MHVSTEVEYLAETERLAADLQHEHTEAQAALDAARDADADTALTVLPHAIAALQALARAGGRVDRLTLGRRWGGERLLEIAPDTGRLTIRWTAPWAGGLLGGLAGAAVAQFLATWFVAGSVPPWVAAWGAAGGLVGFITADMYPDTVVLWRTFHPDGTALLRALTPREQIRVTRQAVQEVEDTRWRLRLTIERKTAQAQPLLSLEQAMAQLAERPHAPTI